jgi:methylated-DNA-[protein]-cysteine S-methyltransferase
MKLFLSEVESPMGELLLVTDSDEQVRALDFADHKARIHRGLREHYGNYELIDAPAPKSIVTALTSYFAGDTNALAGIPTATGGSEFQRQVWKALLEIPAGQTTTYGKIARSIGCTDPRAAIDVGAAIGANPIDLIVPCHRVIGSNGELKGYAGGVHRKRWLLEHEGAITKKSERMETARLPGC